MYVHVALPLGQSANHKTHTRFLVSTTASSYTPTAKCYNTTQYVCSAQFCIAWQNITHHIQNIRWHEPHNSLYLLSLCYSELFVCLSVYKSNLKVWVFRGQQFNYSRNTACVYYLLDRRTCTWVGACVCVCVCVRVCVCACSYIPTYICTYNT